MIKFSIKTILYKKLKNEHKNNLSINANIATLF